MQATVPDHRECVALRHVGDRHFHEVRMQGSRCYTPGRAFDSLRGAAAVAEESHLHKALPAVNKVFRRRWKR